MQIYKKSSKHKDYPFTLLYLSKQYTMNFTDFSDDFAKEFGISNKRVAKKMLIWLTKQLKQRLIFGTEVSLREIGCFKLKVRQSRKYLNFQNNQMDVSKKTYYLKFRPTEKMKKRLKQKTIH